MAQRKPMPTTITVTFPEGDTDAHVIDKDCTIQEALWAYSAWEKTLDNAYLNVRSFNTLKACGYRLRLDTMPQGKAAA